MPTLTPSILVHGEPNIIPEEEADAIEDKDLRKRARYLRRCKDLLWSRWTVEYIRSLRERHNLKHKTNRMDCKEGDVVIIKSDERNRGKWKIDIVVKLIQGRDGIPRAARLRAGKTYLERPVQFLYPLELSCDLRTIAEEPTLNPGGIEFRPRRKAATDAEAAVRIIAEEDEEI